VILGSVYFATLLLKYKYKIKKNMETFYYNDNLYSELSELVDYLEITEENIDDFLNKDNLLEVYECDLEPIITVDDGFIEELVDQHTEERLSEENCDNEHAKILLLFKENINVQKINEAMPKLWYSTDRKLYFTKAEILDVIK
jgi:hypothetical protein